jgi:hypothetical protein
VAAAIAVLLSAPLYEAGATLVVLPPKLGQSSASMNPANVRALLENQTLAAAVIEQFRLGGPPLRMTPRVFLDNRLRIEEVRNTNFLRLSVRLPDAKLAADVTNALADKAVELNRGIDQLEARSMRDQIREQLDRARERMSAAEAALLQARRSTQLEVLKKDAEAILTARGEILELALELETLRARVQRGEQELSKQSERLTLRRSIAEDPLLVEGARAAGREGAGVLGLSTSSEVPNMVREDIERELSLDRTQLSGLERRWREAVQVRGLTGPQLAVFEKIYSREIELKRLEAEHDVTKKVYEDLSVRYEQAQVEMASRSAQLQVVDRAIAPDSPLAAQRLARVAAGALAGLLLAAVAAALLPRRSDVR